MTDSTFCTENLAAFLVNLRSRGFLVSTAEAGDVAHMLSVLGLEDRTAVRTALRSMLAKSQRENKVFDEEFDEFFVPEQVIIERGAQQVEADHARARRINFAREHFGEYDLPEEVSEAYADGSEKRRQWLQNMIDRVNDSPRYMPLAEDYIKRIATGWLTTGAAEGVEKRKRQEDDLLYKNLASISEDEVPRALALIETLVRRINGSAERKYKRSGRNGMPDLRATIHSSLRTGGVPLHPQYKKRPRTGRHTVVLCDVSESMYRFSGFALRFITALSNSAGKTAAYIFSEGIQEISLSNLSTFEDTVKNSDLWRRGTNAGGAIEALIKLRPSPLNQQTLFIILSDAKTVNPTLAVQALYDAKRITRSILWLNPDMQPSNINAALSEHCSMLDCGTLGDLARACAHASVL